MIDKLNFIGFILGVYAFVLTFVLGLLKKELHQRTYIISIIISTLTILIYLLIDIPIIHIYQNNIKLIANIFLLISVILIIIILRLFARIKSLNSSPSAPIITIEECSIIGLKNFYIKSKITLDETIEKAQSSYKLLAVSAEYVQTGEFRSIVERKKSCKFQFLLLNPSRENEGTLIHAYREKRDDLREKIIAGTKGIYSLRENFDLDMECRYYYEAPKFRMVILNSNVCYLGYYGCTNYKGIAFQGIDLPQMELKKTEKGLFIPFYAMHCGKKCGKKVYIPRKYFLN